MGCPRRRLHAGLLGVVSVIDVVLVVEVLGGRVRLWRDGEPELVPCYS